jgi:SAM-dependent methyltransferase
MPLAKLLYSNRMSGANYYGFDINEIYIPDMLQKAVDNGKMNVHAIGKCDATRMDINVKADIITCFEVFEHMVPSKARDLVYNMYRVAAPGAHMFFSTPNWNGKAAANHINETNWQAVGTLLEEAGWEIQDYYGTFASIADYKDKLSECELDIFERLREYYDTNVLATIMAPLYPRQSRNILWHCTASKDHDTIERRFGEWSDVPTPWSQHPNWEELK